MARVTDQAAGYLQQVLSTHGTESQSVVRLGRTESSWGIRLDRVQHGDEVIEYDGSRVLAFSGEFSESLEGAVLDVMEGERGPRLVLSLPDDPR